VEAARTNLRAAFERLEIRDRWNEWESSSPGTPELLRALGSPTVLVNGRDVAGAKAADGASCRLYETAEDRRSGAPTAALIEKALLEAGLPGREPSRGWAVRLLVAPGVIVGTLPTLACAACWPAYAALLSAVGLGFLATPQYLLPLTIPALALAVAALAWTSRGDRRPLVVGVLGAIFVLVSKFALGSNLANLSGASLLVAASLWSMSRRSESAADCASCIPASASSSCNVQTKGGDP
jgi:hypothetical protein